MKFSRHFAGAALLAALSAPCAHAAYTADGADAAGRAAALPGGDGPRHGFGAPGPGAPGPDAPPFHSVLHALHRLDLSEAQQDKLFAITHAAAPRQREQEKAERKAHEALLALGASASFDEARAGAAARALGQESQVLALLTPEQREQLRAHRPPGPRGRQPERQPDQATAPE
jgi:protein CpxP